MAGRAATDCIRSTRGTTRRGSENYPFDIEDWERESFQQLAENKVSAAGIDVLPEEPVIRQEAELLRSVYEEKHDLDTLLADNVLIRMRNVVVTPHSAFNTKEAVQRILDTTIDNIRSYIERKPQNVVAKTG